VRVALIHYWLVNWRGGEKVLRAIADLFPEADIFTHVADPEIVSQGFPNSNISTTFIARLPYARRLYQRYLPLMPLALEQLDLRQYDLVISSEAGPAKGVLIAPHATHVCYCHSPMRYVWDMYHDYHEHSGAITRALMGPLLHYVRLWDQTSAQRVDRYIANSQFVAKRIEKYYRRTSDVIYPPVAIDSFDASKPAEDFYLSVGQLVRYKRIDLLVEAFNELQRPLVIIGDGDMLPKLRRMAKPNVQVLGRQPFEVIRNYYSRCRALVFPGIEDFGMVPVEAMASGKPVIALAQGGVRESVIDGLTGVLFSEQTPHALTQAVMRFESMEGDFDRQAIRAHARQFSEEVFKDRFRSLMASILGVTNKPEAVPARPRKVG
jgi:glycosyltransferase involved in cell wall biosynthesis